MTTTMTERDKKLLAGLAVFCLAALLLSAVLLPVHKLNTRLKQTVDDNETRIQEMKDKTSQMTLIQAENEAEKTQLQEAQEKLFPMLRTQDVDKMLTEKVLAHGLSARKLQITMPNTPANLTGYKLENDPGSNPESLDGIWIAEVTLEMTGAEINMDQLIDDLSEDTDGVRVVRIDWNRDRRTIDDTTGLTATYEVLTLQLQVLMSGKD